MHTNILTRMSNQFRYLREALDEFERDARVACQPENGIYVTYEMTSTHWQIETNENGDVIHRRLSIDEVEALKTHSREGNS